MNILNKEGKLIVLGTLIAIGVSWIILLHFKIIFINDYLVTLTDQVGFIGEQQDKVNKKIKIVKPYIDLIKVRNELRENDMKTKALETEAEKLKVNKQFLELKIIK